jgi:DNA-directed RNA polymerase I subunit RPA2
MVINKGSFERGFAHGMVIKVERFDSLVVIDLFLLFRLNLVTSQLFGNNEYDSFFCKDPESDVTSIGLDGLPIPGRLYRQGDVYYSSRNKNEPRYKLGKYKSVEPAYCGIVRLLEVPNEGRVVSFTLSW